MVVIGPCSIHDTKAAMEYAPAGQARAFRRRTGNRHARVLRKPRTTVGWKGLINDPYMDNSFRINDGLRMARELLRDINELGCRPAPNSST
jgi:3-deoxy-7-phosphoheptulonate synthase